MTAVFNGKLPKDDLYWQIKAEIDAKSKGRAAKKPTDGRPMLPTVHAT
jgi:hypothetical protein